MSPNIWLRHWKESHRWACRLQHPQAGRGAGTAHSQCYVLCSASSQCISTSGTLLVTAQVQPILEQLNPQHHQPDENHSQLYRSPRAPQTKSYLATPRAADVWRSGNQKWLTFGTAPAKTCSDAGAAAQGMWAGSSAAPPVCSLRAQFWARGGDSIQPATPNPRDTALHPSPHPSAAGAPLLTATLVPLHCTGTWP